MADLLGKNLTYEGRRLVIPPEGGVFGRDPRNHLVITHESVSSLHGIFRVEDGALFARDQQSTNGTRLNGREIAEAQVQDGDRLEIGDLLFLLSAPEYRRRDAPAPTPEPAPLASPPPSPAPRAPAEPLPPVPVHQAGFLDTPSPVNTAVGVLLMVAVVVALFAYLSTLGPAP